jgi:HEPN domain-containing protein
MAGHAAHEYAYIEWQNRATRFYLAARRLYLSELSAPSAYCAAIAIELLLKATLIYWDRAFNPSDAGHAIAKLARMARNKVPNAKTLDIPTYFYFEQRYLTTARYPSGVKGVGLPASFLPDLDGVYAYLLFRVPFQHNTELCSVLRGRSKATLSALRRGNAHVRSLRRFLKASLR